MSDEIFDQTISLPLLLKQSQKQQQLEHFLQVQLFQTLTQPQPWLTKVYQT